MCCPIDGCINKLINITNITCSATSDSSIRIDNSQTKSQMNPNFEDDTILYCSGIRRSGKQCQVIVENINDLCRTCQKYKEEMD